MPDPVKCPDGEARKSIAIYYMSDARPEATPRYKASYRPRPGSLHPDGELVGALASHAPCSLLAQRISEPVVATATDPCFIASCSSHEVATKSPLTPAVSLAVHPACLMMMPDEAGYAQLCRIRERRRLEHDDVKAHLPNFKPRWALS